MCMFSSRKCVFYIVKTYTSRRSSPKLSFQEREEITMLQQIGIYGWAEVQRNLDLLQLLHKLDVSGNFPSVRLKHFHARKS